MVGCLAGFAGVLAKAQRLHDAAWMFGAAQGVLDASGTQISPSNTTDYGRNLVSVTLAMDDQEYSEAFEAGHAASVEETITRFRAAVKLGEKATPTQ